MKLRIKASLGGRLRRIILERDGLTYDALVDALSALCPADFPADALEYTDRDGDVITLATDSELTAAFPVLECSTLCLTVVPSGALVATAAAPPKAEVGFVTGSKKRKAGGH